MLIGTTYITASKTYTFSCAHWLPRHAKCGNMHGHNYTLEVTIARRSYREHADMVMDFHDLDKVVEPVVEKYDHKTLNTLPEGALDIPTAENIIQQLANEIAARLPEDVQLYSLRLWETDRCFVSLYRKVELAC